MDPREFARYAGITVGQALYWRQIGLRYDGHRYYLANYTKAALRKLVRDIPNHPSIYLNVKPELYHAALETQPGEVEIPRRFTVPPTPRCIRQ